MPRPVKRRAALWKVSLPVLEESEEALSEALAEVFGQPPSTFCDVETGKSVVEIYLPHPPHEQEWSALQARIESVRQAGLPVGREKPTVTRLRAQDWAESWKRHFKPIEVGHRLLIRPTWSKRRAKKGHAVIVLDPGLSFGTGQHPTTRFCVEQVVRFRNDGVQQSFLDLGTGSGILAIAAARLGYSRVDAYDIDPQAVRIAQENARRNRVGERLRIRRADLAQLRPRANRRYDLVCANLIYDLLLEHRDRILSFTKPSGRLVLAGILRSQFNAVCRSYAEAGRKVLASRAEKEWESGLFVANKKQRAV